MDITSVEKHVNRITCISDTKNIYFDGCNALVRSGGGGTYVPLNGKGNIIIEYNEQPARKRSMEALESAEGKDLDVV